MLFHGDGLAGDGGPGEDSALPATVDKGEETERSEDRNE